MPTDTISVEHCLSKCGADPSGGQERDMTGGARGKYLMFSLYKTFTNITRHGEYIFENICPPLGCKSFFVVKSLFLERLIMSSCGVRQLAGRKLCGFWCHGALASRPTTAQRLIVQVNLYWIFKQNQKASDIKWINITVYTTFTSKIKYYRLPLTLWHFHRCYIKERLTLLTFCWRLNGAG